MEMLNVEMTDGSNMAKMQIKPALAELQTQRTQVPAPTSAPDPGTPDVAPPVPSALGVVSITVCFRVLSF